MDKNLKIELLIGLIQLKRYQSYITYLSSHFLNIDKDMREKFSLEYFKHVEIFEFKMFSILWDIFDEATEEQINETMVSYSSSNFSSYSYQPRLKTLKKIMDITQIRIFSRIKFIT